jgi:hypothetical protein
MTLRLLLGLASATQQDIRSVILWWQGEAVALVQVVEGEELVVCLQLQRLYLREQRTQLLLAQVALRDLPLFLLLEHQVQILYLLL